MRWVKIMVVLIKLNDAAVFANDAQSENILFAQSNLIQTHF